MRKRKIMAVFLSAVLTASFALNCYAETTQEQIDSKKAEQKETQADYQNAQKTLKDLQGKKNDKEAYLTELNDQMAKLKDNLADLQKQYDDKQVELDGVLAELDSAEADRQKQYEDMKLRIQYMYENDMKSSYLDMLLSADSFGDFLNKAENISAITSYDRDMLQRYEETVQLVQEKEEKVKEEQAAIEILQSEYEKKEEAVADLVEDTYIQIRQYESEIQDSQTNVSSLLKQINSQEDELNSLLKKQKDEQAAAKKAAEAKAAAEKKAAEEQAAAKAAEKEAATKKSELAGPEVISQSAKADTSQNEAKDTSADAKKETQDEKKESTSSSEEYLGHFKLTAYCPCVKCCGKSDGITASGTKATAGRTVAMGGVPLGTKISINGKIYTVEDRGTVYGHVDIFFNSHSEALQFGKRYADVYLVN